VGLELLREADMILDACGRPSPPAGYRFVDLPRAISYRGVNPISEGSAGYAPFSNRIENRANTLFMCRGIASNVASGADPSWRIKWPTGRFLSQSRSGLSGISGSGLCFPTAFGPNMFALNVEEPIEAGGRVTIEVSGSAGTLDISLWGALRYLLKESAAGGRGDAAVSCIVGYPDAAKPVAGWNAAGLVRMIPNPIFELDARRRYQCGPNTNIMAPEWLLGNQATLETLAGYEDEPFTFFSQPIAVAAFDTSINNAVIVPGNDDFVLKRLRAYSTWPEGLTGSPTFSLRIPNGYSITGGDMIPLGGSTLFAGLFEWLPQFPTILVHAGDRLILDVGSMDSIGAGDITTVFEFEGVKRRRIQ